MGSAVLRRDHVVLGGGRARTEVYQAIQPMIVRKGSTLSYSIILVEEEAIICRDTFRASVSH